MAKKYKGFKGSGMNKKMSKREFNRLVKNYFVEYVFNGCKRRKESEGKNNE